MRAKLPQAVVHSIQQELRSDDPTGKICEHFDYKLSKDPQEPNVGASISIRTPLHSRR